MRVPLRVSLTVTLVLLIVGLAVVWNVRQPDRNFTHASQPPPPLDLTTEIEMCPPVRGGPGKYIVFSATPPDAILSELFRVEPSGNGLCRLTNNDYIDALPQLSPDGTLIAFQSGPSGESCIYITDLTGGRRFKVICDEIWPLAGWLHDGRLLWWRFGEYDDVGEGQMTLVDVQKRAEILEVMMVNEFSWGRLSLSPSKEKLLTSTVTWNRSFERIEVENESLILFDLERGGMQRIPRATANAEGWPSWISDNEVLYQETPHSIVQLGSGYTPDTSNIYWLDLNTQIRQQVIEDGQFPVLSPDGERLAFMRDDALYIANLDGSNVRRITPQFRGMDPPDW